MRSASAVAVPAPSDRAELDPVEIDGQGWLEGFTPDTAILVNPMHLDRRCGSVLVTPVSVRRGEGRQVALGLEEEEGEDLSPRAEAFEAVGLSIV